MFQHVLLCTHGTQGAKKAEAFVFGQLKENPDLQVSLLTVLDQDWQGMTGDDWLNSSKTHAKFLDHVEEQVSLEIKEEWQRIRTTHPVASKARFIQRTGPVAETIAGVAKEIGCDLIAMGRYHKPKGFLRGHEGKSLKDTLKNKRLHPLLPCPLIIVP